MSNELITALQSAAGNVSGDFYPYTIDNSCRFDGASYLTKTNVAGSSSNSDFSFSFWAKVWGSTADNYIFAADSANTGHVSTQSNIQFAGGELRSYFASNYEGYMTTSAVFRDVSSWYHFLVVYDASEPYGSRGKIYVNGIETPLSTDTLNLASGGAGHHFFDSGKQVRISGNAVGVADSYNRCAEVYMAQVVMIDGQALDPTSFGEEKNGVWIPKDVSGLTFGTNGFYLDFADSSNLGNDVSGNNNDFTSSGLTSSDQMIDTPTNSFPTMNPVWQINTGSTIEATLSNGNLTATTASANLYNNSVATMPFPSTGKWYCEAKFTGYVNSAIYAGVIAGLGQVPGATEDVNNFVVAGASTGDCSISLLTGKKRINNVTTTYGTAVASGSVLMFAVDMDNQKIYFGDDGTWMNSGDPVAGTGFATDTLVDEVFLALTSYSNGDKYEVNFGQTPFAYTPPTDFLALCTANLPEPTIGPNSTIKTDEVFASILYTGNGTARSIDVGFQPDFTWIKNRDAADSHTLFDSVRGATKYISSNSTNAEATDANSLTAFDSIGFDLGTSSITNGNTEDYVAWNWKAGGTGVSNTDGATASTVSANTDAGFSIVTYTGTGSVTTVGHGLGVTPNFIIVKARDEGAGYNWCSYSSMLGPTYNTGGLDVTSAADAHPNYWANTAPTSSVFTVSTYGVVNDNGGQMLAYCFAEVEGFSKFGSWTGVSGAEFIYTGFRPAFVLVKRTNSSGWYIFDNKRGYNGGIYNLQPNTSGAESGPWATQFNLYSNGFEDNNYVGDAGTTIIYMAFAENPFKYSNAR